MAQTPNRKPTDWQSASKKAWDTCKNAKTFTKYKLNQAKYRYLTFESKKGYEGPGITDLVAVKCSRNDKGQLDNLKIILFQVKGGKARVKPMDIDRLSQAVKNAKIEWNIATKPGKQIKFEKAI